MWISRKEYDALRLDNVKLREESSVLNRTQAAFQATFDWMRVRVTQLELERNQLISKYMGVEMPTPVIHQTASPRDNPMGQLPTFQDVGDDEARKLGVNWHDDGTVHHQHN